MPASVIIECGCSGYLGITDAARFQDQTYGPRNRVHNPTATAGTFRCSVCGAKRGESGKGDKAAGKKA